VKPLGSPTLNFVLALVALGALVACDSAGPDARQEKKAPATASAKPASGAKFDFYLLAMTVHAAFCADGHQRKAECRARGPRPLVIHGLWPENFTPRTYPHDCPAPRLQLDPLLEQQLQELMPGMADGLHEHEWREHGGCSDLDDDLYFSRTLDLARELDAALAAKLTTLAGRETDAAELRGIADLFRPGIGATFTLHCRTLRGYGNTPVLFELRQCVDNDGPGGAPGTLLDCVRVKRRDQGCGKSFLIAEAGR
jgi:ribonuclease T2